MKIPQIAHGVQHQGKTITHPLGIAPLVEINVKAERYATRRAELLTYSNESNADLIIQLEETIETIEQLLEQMTKARDVACSAGGGLSKLSSGMLEKLESLQSILDMECDSGEALEKMAEILNG